MFRMFSKMAGKRLSVTSDAAVPLDVILRRGVRERPEVSALASRDGGALYILVWHYHDEDVSGPAATVTLNVSGLPTNPSGAAHVTHYRVDEEHSNAFTTWKRMGSPQNPSRQQYAELESSCQLEVLTDPAAGYRRPTAKRK